MKRVAKEIWIALAGWLCICCLTVMIEDFTTSRNTPSQNACINNLRQIDGAKQTWALEAHKTTNDTPTWDDIRPYLGRGTAGEIPVCPKCGSYIIGKVGEAPKCTYPGHSLD